MDENGPPSPRTAARAAARAARNNARARGLPTENITRAGAAAARTAYNEVKGFLETECALVGNDEKEFLSIALSQLSDADLAVLSQSGDRRLPNGTQRGGALGQALVNFLRALCGKVRGAVDAGARSAAAALDARATELGAATPGAIGAGVLRALPVTAGSAVGLAILSGHSSKVIALAMTALKGINAILPGAATVSVSTYSGLAQWLPLAQAGAPVAGKLFAIFVCYRAVVITAQFLNTKIEEFRLGGGFDYDRLLRALMRAIYTGIVTGAPIIARGVVAGARATPGVAYAAGSAVISGVRATPGAVASGARATGRGAMAAGRGAMAAGRGAMAAGRATVEAGAAALAVVDGVIDAAVEALLGGANADVAHALVDAAVGPDAPAAGGAGAVGPAAVIAAGDAAAAAGDAAGAAAAGGAAAGGAAAPGAAPGAGEIPAGLDALALMAAAMPALEVEENDYAMGGNGVPHSNQLSDIENARKSRKRKQAGGKRSKPKTRRNRKNRK